jgi:hypothetical protein
VQDFVPESVAAALDLPPYGDEKSLSANFVKTFYDPEKNFSKMRKIHPISAASATFLPHISDSVPMKKPKRLWSN